MPALPFVFSGPPTPGAAYTWSDWLSLSTLRSCSALKTLGIGTSDATKNKNLVTQLQISGDAPSTDPANIVPTDFDVPQKGPNFGPMIREWSANWARVGIANVTDESVALSIWLGVEYETDAEATQLGAYLNNAVVIAGPGTQLTNKQSGAFVSMEGVDATVTLPDLATAADGETHFLKRYDHVTPGGSLTLVAKAGQSILDYASGVVLPSDGDSVLVTKLSSTQWVVTTLTQRVSSDQVLPIPTAAASTAGLTPLVGRSVRNVGAQTKTVKLPSGAPSVAPVTYDLVGVTVVKETANGDAGDTVQVFKGATPLTDAISLNISNKAVAFAATIDSSVALAAGDNITVVTTQGGVSANCRTTLQFVRTG